MAPWAAHLSDHSVRFPYCAEYHCTLEKELSALRHTAANGKRGNICAARPVAPFSEVPTPSGARTPQVYLVLYFSSAWN